MAPGGTVRERLRDVLREGPATAKDLSRRAGVAEREVPAHLAHLARSLVHRGERLRLERPACLDCGFDFPAVSAPRGRVTVRAAAAAASRCRASGSKRDSRASQPPPSSSRRLRAMSRS